MEYIEIHRISQDYFHKKVKLGTILEDVNLVGRKGEIIGIVGRKPLEREALIQILSGMCAPKTGSFFLDSVPLPFDSDQELASFRSANIGLVSKAYPLLEKWNVLHNVTLPLVFNKKITQQHVQKMSARVLAYVDMAEYANREVWPLTAGERVRIMLARAMVNRPKLLVGDDLLEGLNHFQARKVMEVIAKLPDQGITAILVMEDEELFKCCSRHVLLKDGKAVEI